MKKILFYNISGAIHSNNISEILILFEYFRNMYPCHRSFKHIYILLSFIDHSFEERRKKKKLKMKQGEESITNIKLRIIA